MRTQWLWKNQKTQYIMAEENKIRKMIREAIHEALEDIFKPKDRISYLDSIDLKKSSNRGTEKTICRLSFGTSC